MRDSLEELKFNYDTLLYLKSLNWTDTVMMEYFVNDLNYPSGAVTTLLTLKTSYLNSVLKRLDLYVDLKLSNEDIKLYMSKYNNLTPLVDFLLDSSKSDVKVEETTCVATSADVVEEVKVEEVEEVEVNELDVVVEEEDDDDESSVFEKFLKENVEQTDNDNDKMKSSQVYSKFKKWYSSQYDEDTPSKTELKTFLNEKLGKSVKSVWKGVSLK
jgi:hypothetical protein